LDDAESAPCPPPASAAQAFSDLYATAYRSLLRDAILAGGSVQTAEDAVQDALTEVFRRWHKIANPRAYARRATISNLIKSKQRGSQRILARQIERGDYRRDDADDAGLRVWEEKQWVVQLLRSLPAAQRETLAFIIDEFSTEEVAQLLGKTDAAVRYNLCAARRNLRTRLQADTGLEVDRHLGSATTASMERR
jgi:RNA polymerase sigma factor (sigma-70 family)